MFGEKRESTLVNYKGQADPELFNLSKYQQVQGSEFKRKAEKIWTVKESNRIYKPPAYSTEGL